jgi:hypothetical protein
VPTPCRCPSTREAAALAYLAVLVTALVSAWAIGASTITPPRLLGALAVGVGVAAGVTFDARLQRRSALVSGSGGG